MSAAMSVLIRGCDPVQRPVEIPMSQQSALGSHGHDMHPQEFVRLSGCQNASAREKQVDELHR